jgi:hypothetical protein
VVESNNCASLVGECDGYAPIRYARRPQRIFEDYRSMPRVLDAGKGFRENRAVLAAHVSVANTIAKDVLLFKGLPKAVEIDCRSICTLK